MAATTPSRDTADAMSRPEPASPTGQAAIDLTPRPFVTRALRPFWTATSAVMLMGDSLAGRRDGRRGLPLVDDETAAGTPRLEEIHRSSRSHLDRIRGEVLADSAGDVAREVELAENTLPRAKERLAEAESRLDDARSARVASGRRLGEESLPQDLVDRRREQESRRRIGRAMQRVEDERTEVRRAAAELEAVRRRLRRRADEAYAEAEQVYAWASRRATRYLHAALRRHPDRAAFAKAYPAFLPPPPTAIEWWESLQLEMT